MSLDTDLTAEAPAAAGGPVVTSPTLPERPRATLLANALDGLEGRFLADRLLRGRARQILHVARDQPRMAFVAGVARFFAPRLDIVTVPAWDCLPYDRVSPNAVVMAERLASLARLAEGPGEKPQLVLTTANAVLQKVPTPETVRKATMRVRAGARADRDGIVTFLERNGYRRTGAVVEAGEYAVRGGLIDIFASGQPEPVRLDFFGATVESIRRFDPLSQRSSVKLPALELRPVSEVMLDPAAAERFIGRFLQRFGAVTNDPMLEAVQAGRAFPGVEHWLPLFHEEVVPLTDYLAEGAELAFDHSAWEAIRARAALIGEHYEARRQPPHAGQSFGAAPYRPLPPDLLYVDEQSFTRWPRPARAGSSRTSGRRRRDPRASTRCATWAATRRATSRPSGRTARSTCSTRSWPTCASWVRRACGR
jgi:transcription-repair coupling factor (superfamily II helicase)